MEKDMENTIITIIIMLSEISQGEKDKYMISFTYEILKNPKLNVIDTENRLLVASGRGWGMGKTGKVGKNVYTSSYKKNKFWGCNV